MLPYVFPTIPHFLFHGTINRMDEEDASVERTLEKLDYLVFLESRTLYFIVLGVVALFACGCSQDPSSMGFKMLEYTVLSCCLMDTCFSIFVTSLFLRPMSKVWSDGRTSAFGGLQATTKDQVQHPLWVFASSVLIHRIVYFAPRLLRRKDGRCPKRSVAESTHHL